MHLLCDEETDGETKIPSGNAAYTNQTDAEVKDTVWFGEQYDDSVSGKDESFVVFLQKLPCVRSLSLL